MGYGRHGKDTVADLLRDHYGLKIVSSSYFVAEKAVYPVLKDIYKYSSLRECYDDRHNHRQEWFEAIIAYNNPLYKMSEEIFKENDVYVGIRNHHEFYAAKEAKLFDFAIWVDASIRVGTKESNSSCTVRPYMADFIFDNNGDRLNLIPNLTKIMG